MAQEREKEDEALERERRRTSFVNSKIEKFTRDCERGPLENLSLEFGGGKVETKELVLLEKWLDRHDIYCEMAWNDGRFAMLYNVKLSSTPFENEWILETKGRIAVR